MASVATVNTYVDAAIAAMDGGDWGTALTKLLAAKASLASLPDSKDGDSEVSFDREAIDGLIAQVRQQQAASAVAADGIRRSKVRYAQVSS